MLALRARAGSPRRRRRRCRAPRRRRARRSRCRCCDRAGASSGGSFPGWWWRRGSRARDGWLFAAWHAGEHRHRPRRVGERRVEEGGHHAPSFWLEIFAGLRVLGDVAAELAGHFRGIFRTPSVCALRLHDLTGRVANLGDTPRRRSGSLCRPAERSGSGEVGHAGIGSGVLAFSCLRRSPPSVRACVGSGELCRCLDGQLGDVAWKGTFLRSLGGDGEQQSARPLIGAGRFRVQGGCCSAWAACARARTMLRLRQRRCASGLIVRRLPAAVSSGPSPRRFIS